VLIWNWPNPLQNIEWPIVLWWQLGEIPQIQRVFLCLTIRNTCSPLFELYKHLCIFFLHSYVSLICSQIFVTRSSISLTIYRPIKTLSNGYFQIKWLLHLLLYNASTGVMPRDACNHYCRKIQPCKDIFPTWTTCAWHASTTRPLTLD